VPGKRPCRTPRLLRLSSRALDPPSHQQPHRVHLCDRGLRGFEWLAKVIDGVKFGDGIEIHEHASNRQCSNAAQGRCLISSHTPDLTIAPEAALVSIAAGRHRASRCNGIWKSCQVKPKNDVGIFLRSSAARPWLGSQRSNREICPSATDRPRVGIYCFFPR
jgi:hypothetical protein